MSWSSWKLQQVSEYKITHKSKEDCALHHHSFSHIYTFSFFFFLFSEKENRHFRPDLGQTTPWLLSLQLADLLKPLCSTTIFPVTQYPNLPDWGGLWTRSTCDAAHELGIADEPHGAQGSGICNWAVYSPLSASRQWQPAGFLLIHCAKAPLCPPRATSSAPMETSPALSCATRAATVPRRLPFL